VLPPRTPRDNSHPFTLWVTMGSPKEVTIMLWTMFLVLIVMWLLGMVTGYSAGGIIHILLVLAVISLALQLITRRRLT